MKFLGLAGVLLFMLTSLVVGLRLLGLYRRTRKTPELLMGGALLCSGFLAFAVGTAAKVLVTGTPELRGNITILGLGIEYTGVVAMAVFAWRVFHRKQPWARAVLAAVCLLCAGTYLTEIVTGEYRHYADSVPISEPWIVLGLCARGVPPAWLAYECFRFHAQLRRRASLGLAEPLVVRRVLLWGVAMGASTLAYVVPVVHRSVYGTGLREHVWAINLVATLAVVTSLCLLFAFFPPKSHRARMASLSSVPPRK